MEAVLRRFDGRARLLPHRDAAAEIVIQVFYFCSDWPPRSRWSPGDPGLGRQR